MPKYLSGRATRTPQSDITSDRYEFIGLEQTEPNLGDPVFPGAPTPTGQQYQLVAVESNPGERYWVPIGGGVAAGSISVFNENSLVGAANSTTQLNFVGNAISAVGSVGSPIGIAVTITVSPPGNNGEILFKESNDFASSSNLTFNSSVGILAVENGLNVGTSGTFFTAKNIGVGIGTTNPTSKLNVIGDTLVTGIVTSLGGFNIGIKSGGINITTGILTALNFVGAGNSFVYNFGTKTIDIDIGGGQWTYSDTANTSISNIYRLNGNIGIGTTNPTSKLQVGGNITPSITNTFDLGTPSLKWNNIYVDSIIGNIIGAASSLSITTDGNNVDRFLVLSSTTSGVTTALADPGITYNPSTNLLTATNLNVTGFSTFTGASTFSGITTVTGTTLFAKQLNVSGVVTATTFIGALTGTATSTTNIPNLTGDITSVNTVTTLATVNSNVGEFGSTTTIPKITVNAKGLVTAITTTKVGTALTVAGDSGTVDIDFLSETLTISGGTNLTSAGSGNAITVNLDPNISLTNINVTGISTFAGITTVTGPTLFTNQLSVSGVSTFNGDVILGNANTDNVTFTSTINSNVLPVGTGNFDLGGSSNKWNNIYANNFVGAIIGNADTATTATRLATARNIAITGDLAWNVNFDGSANVTGAGTLTNTGVTPDTYGSTTTVPVFAVDVKGRITSVTNTAINFSSATVAEAVKLSTPRNIAITGDLAWNVNFDGSANVTGAGTLTNTGVTPDTYGSTTTVPVFAVDVKGRITSVTNTAINFSSATVAEAVKLSTPRNIAITGDLAWNVNFDGSANVTGAGTLTNTGVTPTTYGSTTTVPQFAVDAKGRITSVTNVGINFSSATVAQADSIKTITSSTDASFFPTFVDSNNSPAAYEAVYTDGEIFYNPSDNLLTVSKIKLNGLKDSTGSFGSDGAVLRSDGTNAFWDNIPTGSDSLSLYSGAIVRGYTIGGYSSSVAYNTAYKTIHSTDTTSNLGAIMSYYDAYTDGGNSGTFAYSFGATTTSGYADAGDKINKLNMETDTNVSLATTLTANINNVGTMRYQFIRCYVFGSTDPSKFVYATETPTIASTSWTGRNGGGGWQHGFSDHVGYMGSGYKLTFASDTWESWTSAGAGAYKTISTFRQHIYWKNGSSEFRKINSNTGTIAQQTSISTPGHHQEENYHTGENKGYMVGMYNGSTWVNTGGILDYATDTFGNVASVNAPALNSSAACVEFGRSGI